MIMLFAVAGMMYWNSIQNPPVQPKAPSPSLTENGGSDSSGRHFSSLSSSQLLSQAQQNTKTNVEPAKYSHTLEAPKYQRVTFNSHGQLDTWTLLEEQYLQKPTSKEGNQSKSGLRTEPYMLASQNQKTPFLSPYLEVQVNEQAVVGEYQKVKGDQNQVHYRLTTPIVEINRIYQIDSKNYGVTAQIRVKNISDQKAEIRVLGLTRGLQDLNEASGSMFSPPLNLLSSVCAYGEEVERNDRTSLKSQIEDKEPTQFQNSRWTGIDNRYFMTSISSAVHPIECRQHLLQKEMRTDLKPQGFEPLSTEAIFYSAFTDPQAEVLEEIKIYTGPKKLEVLENHEPSLSDAIDFGVFSPICIPMLWAMRSFFNWLSNWGLAIILLTLLVKLITLPLTLKQYKSMAGMKKIQPEVADIKEKFKDDAVRLQQETMALYRKHGVNPVAGCLPMLVMMPIYFALYRTIFSAVELYQAPFFGWLSDLSQPDPYFVTPILLGLLMLVQAQLQPNTSMDEMQRKMLTFFMPIMFGGMMLFLPSGLVLYILVNTVLGIFQQYWTKSKVETTPSPA